MEPTIAYFDGHFVPEESARISLHDAGFVWGATVTDRVRTYQRKFFRLSEHLARFRRSCELCRIPQPVPDTELALFAEHLLEQNGPLTHPDFEMALVMLATPGEDRRGEPGGSPNAGGSPGSLIMYTEPVGTRYQPWVEHGARLITPATRQLPVECVSPQAKMRSRMHWWIAEQEVRAVDPAASALLLDQSGHVTETAADNFAIVRLGAVLTPPRAAVLDGISLRVVEELCGELDIPFVEQPLTPAECFTADAALVTSTPFGVAGVSIVNGRPIPWPGSVLRRLHEAWSRLVGVDIWRDFSSGR